MGIYYTGLARVLRKAGLDVVEVDGWKSRGFEWHDTPDGGMLGCEGILCHHTAGPHQSETSSNYPSLNVVRDGRPGLGGPLAQLGIGYDGTWYVIAAGRCNHAGRVDNWRYSNPYCLGIEAENPGDGSPWPSVQYDSYVRGVAALVAEWEGSIRPRGHKEACVPSGRKIDPTFNMNTFRDDVADVDLGEDFEPEHGGGKPAGGHVKPKPKPEPTPAKKRRGPSGQGPEDTRGIQEALAYLGYYEGRIYEGYGPMLTGAVEDYQGAQNRYGNAGLYEDGDWGKVTQDWYEWTKKLQEALPAWQGIGDLRTDGDYASITHNAVATLQRRNGLYEDGFAGDKTCAFMRAHGSDVPNRPPNRP